jgi:glycine cleavage system H protein
LKYTNDWLWVKQESADTVRIGFTDYAQLAVGNFWTVVLSNPGTVLNRTETFGFIQGEDTMDVNLAAPVSGTIISINQTVLSDYRLINLDPYGAGWLVTIQMRNPDDLKLLLTASQYALNCCPPCHCDN